MPSGQLASIMPAGRPSSLRHVAHEAIQACFGWAVRLFAARSLPRFVQASVGRSRRPSLNPFRLQLKNRRRRTGIRKPSSMGREAIKPRRPEPSSQGWETYRWWRMDRLKNREGQRRLHGWWQTYRIGQGDPLINRRRRTDLRMEISFLMLEISFLVGQTCFL